MKSVLNINLISIAVFHIDHYNLILNIVIIDILIILLNDLK